MDELREHLVGEGLSPRSVKHYLGATRRAIEWFDRQGWALAEASAVQVAEYVAQLPRTFSSRNLARAALRHYWAFAGRVDPPLRALRVPPKPAMVCKALDEGDARILAIRRRGPGRPGGPGVVLALYLGLRHEEVATLRWVAFTDGPRNPAVTAGYTRTTARQPHRRHGRPSTTTPTDRGSAANAVLVALPSCLTRRAKRHGDPAPRPATVASSPDRRLEVRLGGTDGDDRLGHRPQVADVLSGHGVGVKLVEVRLGVSGGLLELFTGSGHWHHLSEVAEELRAEGVGVDSDRVAVGVEHDDLEQLAAVVGTDKQDTVVVKEHGHEGVACGVVDVLVGDAVLAGALGDLHNVKLPCRSAVVKLTCDLADLNPGREEAPPGWGPGGAMGASLFGGGPMLRRPVEKKLPPLGNLDGRVVDDCRPGCEWFAARAASLPVVEPRRPPAGASRS